jgi:hypothetical protein
MLLTVTEQLPLLTANIVNQTLLFTTPSPQLKTGSEPDTVAPTVVLDLEFPEHRMLGEEQLS